MLQRRERKENEIRNITIEKNIMENAYSSVLIQCGKTKVLCTASVNNSTPTFIDEKKMGWLTAEYRMLPGSTLTRKPRSLLKPDGRSIEIQRLIGRALRAAINLKKIKGYSIVIDCDVIQADGGTRTSSITGGFVALELAVKRMLKEKLIKENPLITKIASISAGKVNGKILLDLNYQEDSNAQVDFNVVMNNNLNLIEIQGSGEKSDFTKDDLAKIIEYCELGIEILFKKQEELI